MIILSGELRGGSRSVLKRGLFAIVDQFSTKAAVDKKVLTKKNQYEYLAQKVTPLWQLEYSKQLGVKWRWISDLSRRYKKFSNKKPKLHSIIPSPIINEYRNKDEFNIRTGIDGNPKTVGFFVGSHEDNSIVCVPSEYLINIRKKHHEISRVYQDFIRQSPLPACHDLHDGGYWRNLIVRSNNKGETIAAVVVHPHGASDKLMMENKHNLKAHFLSSGCGLKSLLHQACPHTRCTRDLYPFDVLFGDPYLMEELHGYVFRISIDSFFQINTPVAEILYDTILKFLNPSKKTTVLDLCSGIGTLSIVAHKKVRSCLGIELSSQAVKDSAFNTSNNYVKNCHFVQGRIEQKLQLMLNNLENSADIVAVINPGRAGIGKTAIKALRNCVQLKRLVYVSCKADGHFAVQNFADLCSPTFDSSPCFTITDIQPLDMFPHTNHCEVVVLFQR